MWFHWCKRWLDLCSWCLPKTEKRQESAAESTPSPTATEHMPTGVETVEDEAPKELQEGDVDPPRTPAERS